MARDLLYRLGNHSVSPTRLQLYHLESLIRQREDAVARLADIDSQIEDFKKEMSGI